MSEKANIVLGVSGSIAAYKAADLASRLVQGGFSVFPVLTTGATQFISPNTFTAITGHPSPVSIFDEPFPGEIAHIWLARNCGLFVIAPASMNLIARLAHGLADDMLTASLMATRAPILIAPAMNTGMWDHPATQANLARLREYGYQIIEPYSGTLACGTEGVGKMADVPSIIARIHAILEKRPSWSGIKVLITAGPTREPIDPVRFLSNRSSGKMGYALAEAAIARGASVILISGPSHLPVPAGIEFAGVETAAQMHEAVLRHAPSSDVIIAAAAVADFRPAAPSGQKLRKHAVSTSLALEATEDILATLGSTRTSGQILVGFAAETQDVIESARAKMAGKNLDWIVANNVALEGAGFDVDTNIVTLFGRSGEQFEIPRMRKREVAEQILDHIRPPSKA